MLIKITTQHAGQRLDKFLTAKMSKFSRSQIQKMIKTGEFKINGENATVHCFLKEGDKIEFKKIKAEKRTTAQKDGLKIKVLKETKDYLVINKPAGLLVHAAPGLKEKTLVDWLIKKYPQIKNVVDDYPQPIRNVFVDIPRPGIVHRLDRDVSGLMVVALDKKFFYHIKEQFKIRKIKKVYWALVNGYMSQDEGVINTALVKGRAGVMRVAIKEKNSQAKEAVTEFRVLNKFKNYTLLEINLHTGRTHQIRAHLKSIRHSVVGDELYQTKDVKKKKKKDNLGRLFLFAEGLGFFDLDNQWQEFKLKIPSELKKFLEAIK